MSSYWDRLPDAIVQMIYSFDDTYSQYMKQHVFQISDDPNILKETRFYQSVVRQRYSSHWSEMMQILHRQSIHRSVPLFPQKHEIRTHINYTMRSEAKMCRRDRVMRKLVFAYNGKIHWYLCVDSDISLQGFFIKFLSERHLEFMAFSEIRLFDNLCHKNKYLVASNSGFKFRKNLKWIHGHDFQSAVLTDFDIIVDASDESTILEIDILTVFYFQGKIYLNLKFDDNDYNHYNDNKDTFHLFIYYINQRLFPYF